MTTTPDTDDRTSSEAHAIQKWADDLHSGAVFARAMHSEQSRLGYQPPARSGRYGDLLAGLARLAQDGERCAYVVSRCVHRLPLHGTHGQQNAALWGALFEATREPWRDVIGATGPEAGRPSDHVHEWTTWTLVHLYGAVATMLEPHAGAGWCEAAVRRDLGMPARTRPERRRP